MPSSDTRQLLIQEQSRALVPTQQIQQILISTTTISASTVLAHKTTVVPPGSLLMALASETASTAVNIVTGTDSVVRGRIEETLTTVYKSSISLDKDPKSNLSTLRTTSLSIPVSPPVQSSTSSAGDTSQSLKGILATVFPSVSVSPKNSTITPVVSVQLM